MNKFNIDVIKELYNNYKKENQTAVTKFKNFCDGCKNNIDNIPKVYPGFISIGENPVAGIGFGTSELTKDCQEKMKKDWGKFSECLKKLAEDINDDNYTAFSNLVKEVRGKSLNLFVNRCIITLHSDKLLAIANIVHLRLLYENLQECGYEIVCDHPTDWKKLNVAIFNWLAENLDEKDKATLSFFGWYLKEKLLQMMLVRNTLENCHNIILTGAPGTGKTYMAKEIARQMGAEIEFVQFHPSYDYTDFVEGLRPSEGNGNVIFKREDGIFKAFCKKAVKSMQEGDGKKYVMVIDEINRGEISKIFGELFFSIDPDYRIKSLKQDFKKEDVKDFVVQTQYQNLIDETGDDCFRYGFFVPMNLYIIGTMNDIDRSVESLDFAMRRRFTFIEFIASEHLGMFDKIIDVTTKELAKKKMEALNKAIVNSKIGNLTTAYQIGGAYFVNVTHFANSDDKWEDLWNYHLKGLIFEYYRGQPNADQIIGMLRKEYDNAK